MNTVLGCKESGENPEQSRCCQWLRGRKGHCVRSWEGAPEGKAMSQNTCRKAKVIRPEEGGSDPADRTRGSKAKSPR